MRCYKQRLIFHSNLHIQFSKNDINKINVTKKEEAIDWRGRKPVKETKKGTPSLQKADIYCKALLNNTKSRLGARYQRHWLSSMQRPRREKIEPMTEQSVELFFFHFLPGIERKNKDVIFLFPKRVFPVPNLRWRWSTLLLFEEVNA